VRGKLSRTTGMLAIVVGVVVIVGSVVGGIALAADRGRAPSGNHPAVMVNDNPGSDGQGQDQGDDHGQTSGMDKQTRPTASPSTSDGNGDQGRDENATPSPSHSDDDACDDDSSVPNLPIHPSPSSTPGGPECETEPSGHH
jgi:hypothetical protein